MLVTQLDKSLLSGTRVLAEYCHEIAVTAVVSGFDTYTRLMGHFPLY